VFDYALHFRFLQKATEAMFEMGQASVAASLACQKRIYEDMTPENLRAPEPVSWPSWYVPPTSVARTPSLPQPQPDFTQSWLAMANACSAYWTGFREMPAAQTMMMGGLPLPPAVQAFWGITPWTMYQAPMVAMMLSYGVPYAVAAPTARASTSAMDAADAACAQWRLVFGSAEGQKSLRRNVSATPQWSAYLH
jgi:hypothetical protein